MGQTVDMKEDFTFSISTELYKKLQERLKTSKEENVEDLVTNILGLRYCREEKILMIWNMKKI